MDYDKDAAIEEVKSWKRRDPRPILASLGWMVKPGSYKARFVNTRAEELDLWGGDNGNFYAFSTPGKSRAIAFDSRNGQLVENAL